MNICFPGVEYTPSSVIEDYNYYIVKQSGYGESSIDSVLHQGSRIVFDNAGCGN